MNAPGASGSFTSIAIMMLIVGMGIPVTAALNSVLGTHLGSPVAASVILFGVGFILTAGVLAFVGLPPSGAFSGVPLWSFAAALGVVFYVLAAFFFFGEPLKKVLAVRLLVRFLCCRLWQDRH